MDPGRLIPYADPLPAPWGFFYLLLVVTFFLHLLAANLVVGGAIISLFSRGTGETGRRLARALPFTIAFAVNLGVAPLLFMQMTYGQYVYVSSVLMAVLWISIFALIIAAYYLSYINYFKFDALGGARPWVMAPASVLFLAVSFIFTALIVLMVNPGQWPAYFASPGGAVLPWGDASLIPRFLHFALGSLAVTGLAMALWGKRLAAKGDEGGEAMSGRGLKWYGVSTVANFFMGGIYLGAIPADVLARTVDASPWSLFALLAGVLAGLASIPAAFGKKVGLAAVTALASIVLMVAFRFAVRAAYLAPYLDVGGMPSQPQLSPIIMFLAVLLAGIWLVWYMLRLVSRAGGEVRS